MNTTMDSNFYQTIAQDLNLTPSQVQKTIQLVDEGNTVPFIARYRKEVTNKLDEEQIRAIIEKIEFLRNLADRKQTILKAIEAQGKLTPDLKNEIENCQSAQQLEDLYLPYKKKKQTRATIAKEQGLEPLANLILLQKSTTPIKILAKKYINDDKIETLEDAIQGAQDIIAEIISDNADNRQFIRDFITRKGTIQTTVKKNKATNDSVYDMYFDYEEKIGSIPSHRILAINRGEKEKILRVKINADTEYILSWLNRKYIVKQSPFEKILKTAIADAYSRLISKAIDRDIRKQLTEKAEKKAILVFATNLKKLLLQPPLQHQKILGIDPAYRTGCKVAAIDQTGKYLEGTTIFPHPPQRKYKKAKETLAAIIKKHQLTAIAIGNGTASRETEALVADLIDEMGDSNLKYIIVDEAGASVYSASKTAKAEFPDLEASMRGNISIARRLLDPLSELVKIDPKSIGVGQYQHDVNQKKLTETLSNVVEDCVNQVGVNLNTASASLLQHVAGLTSRTAQNIVQYRQETGKFLNREAVKHVKGIGLSSFQQSAGFLRIPDSDNPLDNTSIHPESYDAAQKLLNKFKVKNLALGGKILKLKSQQYQAKTLAEEIGVGLPTLEDILVNLEKPGLDPRDELPKPIFKSNILKINDLKEGMTLKGTVRNVVDFGAFVDIGLKQAGLVHISELANKFVKDPKDFVSVGDIVNVRIVSIDEARGRIGLSMKNL